MTNKKTTSLRGSQEPLSETRAPPRHALQRRQSTNLLDILVLIDTNMTAEAYEAMQLRHKEDANNTQADATQLCLFNNY